MRRISSLSLRAAWLRTKVRALRRTCDALNYSHLRCFFVTSYKVLRIYVAFHRCRSVPLGYVQKVRARAVFDISRI